MRLRRLVTPLGQEVAQLVATELRTTFNLMRKRFKVDWAEVIVFGFIFVTGAIMVGSLARRALFG